LLNKTLEYDIKDRKDRNMKRKELFTVSLALVAVVIGLGEVSFSQAPGSAINVTTWQQDTPAICTGCVYRTGANLTENKLLYSSLTPNTFGQLCSYAVDGEVFGEPLVVTNVAFNGGAKRTVVYVATQNGSVYAFDGTPSQTWNYPVPGCSLLQKTVLLGSGEVPANCANIGGKDCRTIAPNVGVLSTPVIQANTGGSSTTGTIYLVAESQTSGPSATYYHRIWALDITSLSLTTATTVTVSPPTGCTQDAYPFSQGHLQRPALTLPGDGYLYLGFSMMDGTPSPLPSGVVLAYNTVGLSSSTVPLCLSMSQGSKGLDGAGIWAGGAGLTYGPDSSGTNYSFFTTANGVWNPTGTPALYGDSFIKMWNNPNNGSPKLQVKDYFTPGDQQTRSQTTCSQGGDVDYGSGGVMLIPEATVKYPYLAVNGDKEGGLWFVDRDSPGEGGGETNCTPIANTNVQTYPFNGSATSYKGPIIHTNPSFWENYYGLGYLFIGSQCGKGANTCKNDGIGEGQLLRYQFCTAQVPISNATQSLPGCTTQSAYAYETSGTPLLFGFGSTPAITAASSTDKDAILWAIWSDGSVVPNNQQFVYNGNTFPKSVNGVLYAFDADNPNDANMKKLYGSNDCTLTENGNATQVDQINPATKTSVPTIANGYAYIGTQGDMCYDPNGPNDSKGCYNSGAFYIFGQLTRTCN